MTCLVKGVTVQALLKTMRLLCITASVGRSRSVKNAADTKLSRPTSTAMHKRRSKNQVGLNCNLKAWLKVFHGHTLVRA